MRFKDRRSATVYMIQTVCLLLSSGGIFLQIWILVSSLESYLRGTSEGLWATLVLSGIALLGCAVSAWITSLEFGRGRDEGRDATYSRSA